MSRMHRVDVEFHPDGRASMTTGHCAKGHDGGTLRRNSRQPTPEETVRRGLRVGARGANTPRSLMSYFGWVVDTLCVALNFDMPAR